MKLGGFFLLLLIVTAYAAYPYWSLYSLVQAIDAGNEEALKQYVDWPAVRSGLKEDLSGMLSRETGRAIGSGEGAAAVGGLFASAISNVVLESLINALVTPEALAAMIREGRARERAPPSDSQSGRMQQDGSRLWERVAFAFFSGPATFEAVFRTEHDEDVVGMMQLNGMHWQLIRLRLPSLDAERQREFEDDHIEDEAGTADVPSPSTGSAPVVTAIPRTTPLPPTSSAAVPAIPRLKPSPPSGSTAVTAIPRTGASSAPKPEPPQDDAFAALLKSVQQLDRRVESDTTQAGSGRNPTAQGQARSALGDARLSFSEVDALRRQIGGCWTLPVGVKGIGQMLVQLRIQVRPDRTVQNVTIEDQGRLGSDPIYRAVAESARRAVDKCSPLNLPVGKYAVWRDIMMNLYPEDAISG